MVASSQGLSMADPRTRAVKKTVTAQNQFTAAIKVGGHKKLTVSVSATAMSANVRLQRKVAGDADTEYVSILTLTAAGEKIVENAGNFEYRLGVPTGDFTSATALKVMLAY